MIIKYFGNKILYRKYRHVLNEQVLILKSPRVPAPFNDPPVPLSKSAVTTTEERGLLLLSANIIM